MSAGHAYLKVHEPNQSSTTNKTPQYYIGQSHAVNQLSKCFSARFHLSLSSFFMSTLQAASPALGQLHCDSLTV